MSRRKLVLFLGTDGSGKSALCSGLASQFGDDCSYVYFGLREAHFDWVGRFYQRRGDVGLWARLTVFAIDYFFKTRNLPSNGIVFLDRVPGWAVVSPVWLLRTLYSLILPKVDLLILCYGDPQLIVARKPERSIEGSRKDQEKWLKVFHHYRAKSKLKIDTTVLSLEDSLELVRKEL